MLRPVEYEYLVRPFWSEGRFMLTRVLHEMLVNKAITVANAQKIIHSKEAPRIRPFVTLGPVKMESPELYEEFFLDILAQYPSIWVTDLVLRSHAKLDRDSDNFKKLFVVPALRRKNYITPFWGRTKEIKTQVAEIRRVLEEVTAHTNGMIDPKFLAPRLKFLGNNFILLDAATRKKIGKELPALSMEFSTNLGLDADTSAFTAMDFATFSSSFGDMGFDSGFGDSGFDGFDGGDFGGGGGGDSW